MLVQINRTIFVTAEALGDFIRFANLLRDWGAIYRLIETIALTSIFSADNDV